MPVPPNVPRFIPTLTEVIAAPLRTAEQSADAAEADSAGSTRTLPPLPVPSAAKIFDAPVVAPQSTSIEDDIVHQVLQRIDMLLAKRLAAATAAVVAQHTRAMLPQLREEIAQVVRSSVAEALAQELSKRACTSD